MPLPADPPSSSSCAVLRLPHDIPVHPPRLQHLLPVILAAPDSPLEDKGFPSVRDPAVFPRCPCPSPVTRPQEQQVVLHFITGGILLAHCWCACGTFPALPGGYTRAGPKPPILTFCQILTPRGGEKKKITVPSAKSPFLCYLPFPG